MRKRKLKQEITEYYSTCPYCKKEIKGRTEGQAVYNYDLHIKSCEKKHKKEKQNG